MHKKYKKQLQPVFKYISEYYSESLRLSQLSDLVFLSREQFCRLFKKTTGLTPFEYLNRFRIQKSCEYLAKTDFKIAEIAILSGFNNISYFNRVFKKYRELSPGDYRNTSATIQASRKSAPNS